MYNKRKLLLSCGLGSDMTLRDDPDFILIQSIKADAQDLPVWKSPNFYKITLLDQKLEKVQTKTMTTTEYSYQKLSENIQDIVIELIEKQVDLSDKKLNFIMSNLKREHEINKSKKVNPKYDVMSSYHTQSRIVSALTGHKTMPLYRIFPNNESIGMLLGDYYVLIAKFENEYLKNKMIEESKQEVNATCKEFFESVVERMCKYHKISREVFECVLEEDLRKMIKNEDSYYELFHNDENFQELRFLSLSLYSYLDKKNKAMKEHMVTD